MHVLFSICQLPAQPRDGFHETRYLVPPDTNDIDDPRDDKAINDLSRRFIVCRQPFPPSDLPNHHPARFQFHYGTRSFQSPFISGLP
jgi:hypothetical protein